MFIRPSHNSSYIYERVSIPSDAAGILGILRCHLWLVNRSHLDTLHDVSSQPTGHTGHLMPQIYQIDWAYGYTNEIKKGDRGMDVNYQMAQLNTLTKLARYILGFCQSLTLPNWLEVFCWLHLRHLGNVSGATRSLTVAMLSAAGRTSDDTSFDVSTNPPVTIWKLHQRVVIIRL